MFIIIYGHVDIPVCTCNEKFTFLTLKIFNKVSFTRIINEIVTCRYNRFFGNFLAKMNNIF